MTSLIEDNAQWVARQKTQAASFDLIGDGYDEAFPHRDGQGHVIDLLLERLPAGARVLDLGCGTGIPTARHLVDRGCRVTGVDFSPRMVELARRNVPEGSFECRDFATLGPDFGSFDAVVAFFSLLMLPRAVIVEVLRRLRSMLPEQGYLVLGMVDADLDDVPIPFLGHPVRVSGWPLSQLRDVLRGEGFDVASQSIRSYTSATEGVPPEVQIFLLATPTAACDISVGAAVSCLQPSTD